MHWLMRSQTKRERLSVDSGGQHEADGRGAWWMATTGIHWVCQVATRIAKCGLSIFIRSSRYSAVKRGQGHAITVIPVSVPPFARIHAHGILSRLQSVFHVVAAVDGPFVVLAPSASACRAIHRLPIDMKRAVPDWRQGLCVLVVVLFRSRVRSPWHGEEDPGTGNIPFRQNKFFAHLCSLIIRLGLDPLTF